MSILSGHRVAKFINLEDTEQIQPNGVDLRLDKVYLYPESALDLENYKIEKLKDLDMIDGYYFLKKGAYLIDFLEIIKIPPFAVGLVLPRSTLLRHGLDIRTALWDSGYEGKGKVMLTNYREGVKIKRGMRVAQLILIKAEKPKILYKGQYQGET
ncbi:Deoxycytidine triphosphate deaminase [archaeon HR06]|nr:Deoxycytidine triphosphate deaminase [archaeon HR06]